MKDLLKKPFTFEKLEFWTATAIYIVSIYILVYNQFIQINTGHIHTPNINLFNQHHLPYSYSKYYFIPQFFINTVYYCSFLLLNFYIVKSLINNKRVLLNIILIFLVYALTAIIFGTANTWIKSYLFYNHSEDFVYAFVFKQEFVYCIWIMMLFGFYTIIKYVIRNLINRFYAGRDFGQVTRECMIVLIIWFVCFLFFSRAQNSWKSNIIFSEVVLLGIAIYWYSFNVLIPQCLVKKEALTTYLLKIVNILLISIVPVTLITCAIAERVGILAIIVNIFTIGLNLFFTAPFTWFLYQYRLEKNRELYGLKTALGQSTADLDFLRSQINPHFLFNALNTLYATALQENADRTGEGIQKLGEMMRFMLQENMQEKISLNREVNYLNNYIDLQKLRTQTSPDILIQVEIEEQLNTFEITPMLLIPFVENAFKHGISLREPSHINIALHIAGNTLLFDVYNSIHFKPNHDPEKDKSGIGLDNVKQRLQLLYPDKHELTIRQNGREFFIHLSVTL